MNNRVHQGHFARKRFGQNFLTDQFVIDSIVSAIHPQPGEAVVEIGPGLGALTVRNGLDLILSGDTGSCAVSLLKNKALPVGTLLVELVYVVEAQAPKHLQLTRFLPPTPIRMLMDRKGTNLAAQVEFESFNRQLNAVNRHTSSKLVNAVQQDVHAMLQQAESLVEAQARQLIEQAKQEADDKLSAELARLEALKAVNPNIRDDEVETLEFNRRQVLANLNEAGWRLDAIRLVVVTHQ